MEKARTGKNANEQNAENTELFERLGKLAKEYGALQTRCAPLIEDLKKGGFAHVALLLSQMQLTENLQLCFMAELLTNAPKVQNPQKQNEGK